MEIDSTPVKITFQTDTGTSRPPVFTEVPGQPTRDIIKGFLVRFRDGIGLTDRDIDTFDFHEITRDEMMRR